MRTLMNRLDARWMSPRLTGIDAAMLLAIVILVFQMWLLTASCRRR